MGGGEGRDRSPRAEQEWAGLAEKDSGMQRSPGEGEGVRLSAQRRPW